MTEETGQESGGSSPKLSGGVCTPNPWLCSPHPEMDPPAYLPSTCLEPWDKWLPRSCLLAEAVPACHVQGLVQYWCRWLLKADAIGCLTNWAFDPEAAREKVPRAGNQSPTAALTKAKRLWDGNECGPLWTVSSLNQMRHSSQEQIAHRLGQDRRQRFYFILTAT